MNCNLNALNLRQCFGSITRRMLLTVGRGHVLSPGLGLHREEGNCSGPRQLPPSTSPGLKYLTSNFYGQSTCHSVMARINLQLTKVNLVTSAVEPRIYNGISGYHVWPVGKLSASSLISPSSSSSLELPE